MADLEKMALKRDRGYLVRLVLMLAVGLLASTFVWEGLTGERTGSCLANAFLGAPDASQPEVGTGENKDETKR
ncbi:MAG: hypothetical protein OEZ06_13970 [Myxococcales bacterium]|nr:hypothetical protein [Myxococcales bacterium]